MNEIQLKQAIRHSVNYNGIDAKLNMADIEVADLLMDEIIKFLYGITDVQIYDRMSPSERAFVGLENKDD